MPRALPLFRRFSAATVGAALTVTGLHVTAPTPAAATTNLASTGLVINEISGGNGTGTGATDEFIELYNPTDATITFTGTLQYKSATGASYSAISPLTTFVVAPHGYWLAAGANYSGGDTAPADSTYNFDVSSSTTGGGHVSLTAATTAAPINDPQRVDRVGWGTANSPETVAAPSHPSVGGSLRRTNGVDTGDNSADFTAAAVRSPRGSSLNSAFSLTSPGDQDLDVDTSVVPFGPTTIGGSAPLTYALTAGTLPAGLTLSPATGKITGTTPATPQPPANLTIRATDTNGDPAFASFTLNIGDFVPLSFAAPVVSGLQRTIAASHTLTASGGTAPYTFTSSTLPNGLSLSISGTLSGTPSAHGTYSVTFTVTDSSSPQQSVSHQIDLKIAPAPLKINVPTIPTLTVGTAITKVSVSGSGGMTPYGASHTGGELPPGLTFSSGGISGTPTQHGTYEITVTLTDSQIPPASSSATLTITVNPAALGLTLPTIPTLTLGAAMEPITLAATGGVAPYTYAVTNGSLPDGLSVDEDGELSGTPTEQGTFPVTITATDSQAVAATKSASTTITVELAPLRLVEPTIPAFTVGTEIDPITFTATGGVGPYTYSVDGSIPDGLSLSPSGVLSGTPTTDGQMHVTIAFTDSQSTPQTESYTVEITVNPAPLALPLPTIPTLTVGTQITPITLAATGGVGPYEYAVTAGSLPSGLALDDDGELSGTPTEHGTFNVTITATDSQSVPVTKSASTTITVDPAALGLTLPTIPTLTVGTEMDPIALTATGGVGPYTYAVTNGSLPDGLTLDDDGELSGTPTEHGTFNVTITATDRHSPVPATTSATTTITVNPAALGLILPNVPPVTVGTRLAPVTLTAVGGIAPYTYTVTTGTLPSGITLSNGTLSGTPTARGAFTVTIKVTDGRGMTATGIRTISVIAAPVVPQQTTKLTLSNPGSQRVAALTAITPITLPTTGGVRPYTYTLDSGRLPRGLRLNRQAGTITGKPTGAAAASAVRIRVRDAAGKTATVRFTVSVKRAKMVVRGTQVASGPKRSATLSVRANDVPLSGTIVLRLGAKRVKTQVVDGRAQLSARQLRKLVRSVNRRGGVKLSLRYVGPDAAPFRTRFTLTLT